MEKHYLITKDLNYHNPDGWQLKEGNVIKDVGTNMFIAQKIEAAINSRFQQLNMFEMDLVKAYIKHGIDGVKDIS